MIFRFRRLPGIDALISAAILASAPMSAPISAPLRAQGVDVTARITVFHQTAHAFSPIASQVVLWLTPLQALPADATVLKSHEYALTQKDKQFTPHLLVVPVGSSVDFPNLDPFFHNVFSLFNGKRFDLGLYEGHSHHRVRFDREGVSYIFCNIHPEMGAVIVSLNSPFFVVSAPDGTAVLHAVPLGKYRLNIWAENVPAERLARFTRVIDVGQQAVQLDPVRLETSGDFMNHHENKFGEDYKPTPKQPY